MKTSLLTKSTLSLLLMLIVTVSFGQKAGCSTLLTGNSIMHPDVHDVNFYFGLMELPFLFICVVFAFMTANALKGGKFGKGMKLMAWGFLVMAIGHLHMQVDHFYNFNLFRYLFGSTGGALGWFLALVITWMLSLVGYRSMYKAGKGE
ncbi:hypothetical protein SAMN05421788_1011072 [Filimonas lacunae]|uniref:Uncharacterized protein n=1 Tax=Filimonas lacunae TaxID=477680 RepID=A0A173MQM6_9BACT|nr:hypothetical protein [Filimonas lacunae]BAV09638.1 hypothetical protein FLA_5689 [Filimonas lacunae]SIS76332.1 hypothetical protein SAMN05421788_1011072 [Filimonas lacunae]